METNCSEQEVAQPNQALYQLHFGKSRRFQSYVSPEEYFHLLIQYLINIKKINIYCLMFDDKKSG